MEKPTPIISLKNISRIYQMDTVKTYALNDVSLDVYPGEFLVILGPSGSAPIQH